MSYAYICQKDKSVTSLALSTAHQVNPGLHQPMSEGLKVKVSTLLSPRPGLPATTNHFYMNSKISKEILKMHDTFCCLPHKRVRPVHQRSNLKED